MLFTNLMKSCEKNYDKVAVIHNQRKITYGEFAVQVTLLVEKLKKLGIKKSTRIAVLSNNSIGIID